jgi:hypothetical protein
MPGISTIGLPRPVSITMASGSRLLASGLWLRRLETAGPEIRSPKSEA